MTTRDAYVAILEKRASSNEDVPRESSDIDNSVIANQEHNTNRNDHSSYIHSIFSNASAVQNNQSSEIKKLFKNIPDNATTSNPLLKLARDDFFSIAESRNNFLTSIPPVHREVAFNAFCDEFQKIASTNGWSV